MTTSAAIACPHCAADNTADSHFCQSCGLALPETNPTGPRIIGDADFASNPAGVALQQDELAKQIKKATNALLIVAVIQTGFGFLIYFLLQRSVQAGKVNGSVLLGTLFGVAALFWVLYFWAKQNPFPATLVGLVIYSTLWLADLTVGLMQMSHSHDTAATGSSPFNGIVLRIIIIGILFNGVKAGAKYRQLMQQSGAQ
jgi:hypothetical protein